MGVKQKDEADKGERQQAVQLLSILSGMQDCHYMTEGKLVGREQHSACLHACGSDGHTWFPDTWLPSLCTWVSEDTPHSRRRVLERTFLLPRKRAVETFMISTQEATLGARKKQKQDGQCVRSERYAPRMMDRVETEKELAVVHCMQKNEVVSASPSQRPQKNKDASRGQDFSANISLQALTFAKPCDAGHLAGKSSIAAASRINGCRGGRGERRQCAVAREVGSRIGGTGCGGGRGGVVCPPSVG